MNKTENHAITSWTNEIGEDYVLTDADELNVVCRATYQTNETLVARLQPANREQVQSCVRIANDCRIPLSVVSAGKNFGYGSASPVRSGGAQLDLRRLNAIVDYDDELGVVSIGPGVTQAQLADYLLEQGGNHTLDVTGSSPHCSVLANTLERGFGHTAYSDHFSHSANYEVVLPTGELIHSGFGRFANAHAAPVYRWGVGPSLDGLFSQSRFGIVTRMSIWLQPTPEAVQTYLFTLEEEDALGDLLNVLRPLRLSGVINSAVHIGNAYRALSMIQQYPWDVTEGNTPLSQQHLMQLRAHWKVGAWNGSGVIAGNREQVAVTRRIIKRQLKNCVSKLRFIDDNRLTLARRLDGRSKLLSRAFPSEVVRLAEALHGVKKGMPTDRFLDSAYWRKKAPIPADKDVDRDGCGLIWVSPVAPLKNNCVLEMVSIADDTLREHGFEPGMTLTLLNERAVENVISVTYDRDIPGEDARALRCANTLLDRMSGAGYYPYRLATNEMHVLNRSDPAYLEFERRLAQALDPKATLAPGRYEATR